MLIAFYSTLIIFLVLFIFTLIYLITLFYRKMATSGKVLALFVLLLITGAVSGIYGFDFLNLKTGDLQVAQGECNIEFNENGKSIASTKIEIDEKIYEIKGRAYKHLPDGTYQCKVHYLPITKNIESLYIEK